MRDRSKSKGSIFERIEQASFRRVVLVAAALMAFCAAGLLGFYLYVAVVLLVFLRGCLAPLAAVLA